MSACLVLAWCILPLAAVAGLAGPGRLVAQPSPRTAVSSTATSVAGSTRAAPASAPAPAAITEVTAARRAARPAATWTVRPGDTLSAVAAALGVPGGWPALYAANETAVGPDPDRIGAGTVLTVPGPPAPAAARPAPRAPAPGPARHAPAPAGRHPAHPAPAPAGRRPPGH